MAYLRILLLQFLTNLDQLLLLRIQLFHLFTEPHLLLLVFVLELPESLFVVACFILGEFDFGFHGLFLVLGFSSILFHFGFEVEVFVAHAD